MAKKVKVIDNVPANKMPTTIEALLQDTIFLGFLRNEISEIKTQRKLRPQAREGFHYKRDWYDRMTDSNQLNSAFVIDNIGLILIKQSNLPAEKRHIITYLYEKSLKKTFEYYNQ